ncbi:hypothetical protein D3C72_2442580 [compost metagenome]
MPLSSHQLTMSYSSARTSGFSQFRSGCLFEKTCMKYCSVTMSYSQIDPPKMLSQLLGSAPSFGSAQI